MQGASKGAQLPPRRRAPGEDSRACHGRQQEDLAVHCPPLSHHSQVPETCEGLADLGRWIDAESSERVHEGEPPFKPLRGSGLLWSDSTELERADDPAMTPEGAFEVGRIDGEQRGLLPRHEALHVVGLGRVLAEQPVAAQKPQIPEARDRLFRRLSRSRVIEILGGRSAASCSRSVSISASSKPTLSSASSARSCSRTCASPASSHCANSCERLSAIW